LKKTPHNISAIVLAAGSSQRMKGHNKLLLPFRGKTMIQTVVEKIVSSKINDISVVTGYQREEIEEDLTNYPVRLVWNSHFDKGMSTSIKAGILSANSLTSGYIIILGDMPFVTKRIIKKLTDTFYSGSHNAIIVPLYQGRRGNPVLFSKVYRIELLSLRGDIGARPVVEKNESEVIEVPIADEVVISDIDTYEEYRKLIALHN
jgi:molybdenum cofactor cytidylyltransferase